MSTTWCLAEINKTFVGYYELVFSNRQNKRAVENSQVSYTVLKPVRIIRERRNGTGWCMSVEQWALDWRKAGGPSWWHAGKATQTLAWQGWWVVWNNVVNGKGRTNANTTSWPRELTCFVSFCSICLGAVSWSLLWFNSISSNTVRLTVATVDFRTFLHVHKEQFKMSSLRALACSHALKPLAVVVTLQASSSRSLNGTWA